MRCGQASRSRSKARQGRRDWTGRDAADGSPAGRRQIIGHARSGLRLKVLDGEFDSPPSPPSVTRSTPRSCVHVAPGSCRQRGSDRSATGSDQRDELQGAQHRAHGRRDRLREVTDLLTDVHQRLRGHPHEVFDRIVRCRLLRDDGDAVIHSLLIRIPPLAGRPARQRPAGCARASLTSCGAADAGRPELSCS